MIVIKDRNKKMSLLSLEEISANSELAFSQCGSEQIL